MPRHRPSAATVLSLVALFVALGGTSYAALTITSANVKNNSLTSSDIKNNSVSTADVKNGSLLSSDFKAGQLPAGIQGAPGVPGVPGTAGAKGDKGDKGDRGDDGRDGADGADFDAGVTLASGESESGVYAVAGGASSFMATGIQFRIPLAAPLPGENVAFIAKAAEPTTECPGEGESAPGWLCVYEQQSSANRGNVDASIRTRMRWSIA